jgi:hypothetical protein
VLHDRFGPRRVMLTALATIVRMAASFAVTRIRAGAVGVPHVAAPAAGGG